MWETMFLMLIWMLQYMEDKIINCQIMKTKNANLRESKVKMMLKKLKLTVANVNRQFHKRRNKHAVSSIAAFLDEANYDIIDLNNFKKEKLDIALEKKRTKVTKKLLGQLLNLFKRKSSFNSKSHFRSNVR